MLQATVIAVLSAAALGLTVALVLARQQRRAAGELAEQLRREAEGQRRAAEEHREASLRSAVDTLLAMARETLGAQTSAGTRELEAKKELIDQQLGGMRDQLGQVATLVQRLECERAEQFGQIADQLRQTGANHAELTRTTQSLREALASSKARGQWGERMAEDVLRVAGFVEEVNYRKQTAVAGGRGIPDFTFLLPGERCLHMDVKFPLDNYLRHLDAESDAERDRLRGDFLRDVRGRIKELAGRDYIDPANGTLDYVLLFIPNEPLYGFIHEHDRGVLDHALAHKVVLCSPLTLFAVLAVIRQAMDNFALERTSDEILALLGGFAQQWEKFVAQMDTVSKRLDSAHRAYDDLVGTRRRMLEKPLDKLDELRRERGLEATEPDAVGAGAEPAPLRLAAGD